MRNSEGQLGERRKKYHREMLDSADSGDDHRKLSSGRIEQTYLQGRARRFEGGEVFEEMDR
jgi:hypothetical protein